MLPLSNSLVCTSSLLGHLLHQQNATNVHRSWLVWLGKALYVKVRKKHVFWSVSRLSNILQDRSGIKIEHLELIAV